MDVLGLNLSDPNTAAVRGACAELELNFHRVESIRDSREHVVTLAMFCEYPDAASLDDLGTESNSPRGTHLIALLRQWSGPDTLVAIRKGFTLVHDGVISQERTVKALTYLRDVSPPDSAQTLFHDPETNRVRTADEANTELSPNQSELLTKLAKRPGQILPRSEVEQITEQSPAQLVTDLKQRLTEIGSEVRILKVPHMGFRLVGSVSIETITRSSSSRQ